MHAGKAGRIRECVKREAYSRVLRFEKYFLLFRYFGSVDCRRGGDLLGSRGS